MILIEPYHIGRTLSMLRFENNVVELTRNENEAHSSLPLGFLLRQAAATHRLRMDRALADLGVTPPQFLIIALIAANPFCSNADLARLASLTTPTVTVILNNLATQNLFNTTKHPIDKRVKLLKLSEMGEALLAECRIRAAVVEDELKAQLSASDSSIIAAWLQSAAIIDRDSHERFRIKSANISSEF